MSTKKVLLFAGAASIAVPIFLAMREWSAPPSRDKNRNIVSEADNSRVKHVVEDTLAEHRGEFGPVLHAFEEALNVEMNREHGLFQPT